MKKLTLILEKTDGEFVGRINYQDNLIVDSATEIKKLEQKLARLLQKFHDINASEITFRIKYDLSSLFENFHFLKISNVAELAGINPSLLRQYVTGAKHASSNQAKKIESTIRKLGKELTEVEIYGAN